MEAIKVLFGFFRGKSKNKKEVIMFMFLMWVVGLMGEGNPLFASQRSMNTSSLITYNKDTPLGSAINYQNNKFKIDVTG